MFILIFGADQTSVALSNLFSGTITGIAILFSTFDINLNNINVNQIQSWSLMQQTSFLLFYKVWILNQEEETMLLLIMCHKQCIEYYKKYLREKDLKTVYVKIYLDKILI